MTSEATKLQDLKRDDPARRRRRRIWTRRIVLGALLAMVLAIGGAQLVLWSNLPRQMVVAGLQRQLGLRISAESVSTGWLGRTSLRNVVASLPLSDEPILRIPVAQVRHTSLIRVIFGGSIRLHHIDVLRPSLLVKQNPSGQWNALEAIDLIGRATARADAQRPPSARVALPSIRIDRAVVQIIDRSGREARLEPVNASGHPRGLLVWSFDARTDERLAISGELVPGGVWQHEAHVTIQNADEWINPFLPDWPNQTRAQLHWRGQRAGDVVRGRLQIEALAAGEWGASGLVNVTSAGRRLTIQPQGLSVTTPQPLVPKMHVISGSIELDGAALRASELRLSAIGGEAEVNGAWNLPERSANVHAAWRDLRLPGAVAQTGRLTASLQTPWPGRPKVQAILDTTGALEVGGRWDAQVEINGEGEALNDMSWVATFPRASYEGDPRSVALAGLVVRASARGNVISLDDLTLPPESGQLTGRGQIDLNSRQWWLWLRGGEFVTQRAPEAPVGFDVSTWGTFNRIDIENLYFAAGEAELSITGFYDARLPRPLDLNVWLTHLPPHLGEERSPLVRGRLRSGVQLSGTVAPMDLALSGHLYGRDLFVQSHSLGDIVARLDGQITSEWARINTRRLKVFGGDWAIDGYWPTDPGKSLELEIDATEVPLSEFGDLIGNQRLSGTATGRFELKIPKLRRDRMILDGTFTAENVQLDPMRAARASGQVSLREGMLKIEPIELHEEDGRTTGSVQLDLRRPRIWQIAAATERWPLRLETAGARFIVNGATKMEVDLMRRALHGEARLHGDIAYSDTQIGSATIELFADGRVLHARRMDADLLDGALSGTAAFDLDAPLQTTAQLTARDIDSSRVAGLLPRLNGFSGVWNGQIIVAPATDPRALGPLHIGMQLQSPDGGYRDLAFNSLQMSAFAGINPQTLHRASSDPERWRIVTQSASARIGEGEVDIFARLTRRRDGTLSAHAMLQLDRISLDQIVHAANPESDPMPGRLSGTVSMTGDPRTPRVVFGDANLSLTESDLANWDPIGFLYDLMRVGGRRSEGPDGTGRVVARIENESVQISSLYLFNRGVEVRGAGTIRQIFELPASPIDGMLVGTARPLKDLRIPFMADVDQIFSVLQSNATTAEVSGTLREPKTRATTLDEVNETLRALLVGDVQRETREK